MGYKLYITAFVILLGFAASSQEAPTSPEHDAKFLNGYVCVGAGGGLLTFSGDIGKVNNEIINNNITQGYHFYLERRFGNILGVSAEAIMGKVEDNNLAVDNRMNFESPITQIGINVFGHFDNDIIMKRNSPVAPYLSVGFSYLLFDPHADLQDGNGNTYYYWSNGTVKDMPEAPGNFGVAQNITRDYVYETQLTDSTTNYARNTFAIPLTFGIKIKLIERLEARISGTYNLAQSDYLDNIKDGGNDSYVYSNVSLNYTIGKSKNKAIKEYYKDVDFGGMMKEDGDEDGVKDEEDHCHGTPLGIPVDEHGCPEDKDKDGVPDYMDQEPESQTGATVDEFGVHMNDSMLEVRQAAMRDSVIMERVATFHESHDAASLRKIDKQIEAEVKAGHHKKMPEEFAFADTNGDGIIQSIEITDAIDGFFDGTYSDITVELLHDLIDYFFEQ